MAKLCEFENCRKQASYGYFFKKPERCKEHKEDRRSQYMICRCGNSRPYYKLADDEQPSYCFICKTDEMISIRKGICKENNCNTRASFNFEGEKREIFCSKHKKKNMISVESKTCEENKCNIYPSYNYESEKVRLYCKNHAKKNMINITYKNKKCQEDGCNIYACFNFKGKKKGLYCLKHKKPNMTYINYKKCQEDGCNIHPYFNFENKKKGLYCSKHKKQYMIDVVSKRCKNCADWPDFQQANKKYKNYCTRCFQRLFPKDPLTFQIRCKTKELAVRDYINTIFDGFQHDKSLFTGSCNCPHRRRIDHRKLIGNTLLCIETDEKQHKYYDKKDEKDRYEDLYMAFSGKWIFIRFNPDKYTNKKGVRKNPTIARRLFRLKEEIEKQIKRIENEENKELVEISYLYYDEFD